MVAELEADDGMRDPRRAPVGEENIHAAYLRKVERSSLPTRRVVALGAVVTVADVVNGHVIAVYFRPGGLCHVGLPGPVIRRLQGKPPGQHQDKRRDANCDSFVATAEG